MIFAEMLGMNRYHTTSMGMIHRLDNKDFILRVPVSLNLVLDMYIHLSHLGINLLATHIRNRTSNTPKVLIWL